MEKKRKCPMCRNEVGLLDRDLFTGICGACCRGDRETISSRLSVDPILAVFAVGLVLASPLGCRDQEIENLRGEIRELSGTIDGLTREVAALREGR